MVRGKNNRGDRAYRVGGFTVVAAVLAGVAGCGTTAQRASRQSVEAACADVGMTGLMDDGDRVADVYIDLLELLKENDVPRGVPARGVVGECAGVFECAPDEGFCNASCACMAEAIDFVYGGAADESVEEPCRVPFPLELRDADGYQTTREEWLNSCNSNGASQFVSRAAAVCEYNGQLILRLTGPDFAETRFYDAGTGRFVAATSRGLLPVFGCFETYWPQLGTCARAVVTEVFCGGSYEVGETISIAPADVGKP